MADNITVGIPCYNEEASVAHAIASVLAQKDIFPPEIIVCANGCADHTEEIVLQLAASNPRLRLIRAPRGKPNAWNLIRSAASRRYIMFMDGDVILSENAVSLLYRTLKDTPHAIAAGGRVIPLAGPGNFLGLGASNPDEPPKYPSLVGAGYLIDNSKLSGLMAGQGVDLMPRDIIHDDRWLSGVIGQGKIVVCSHAKIYHLESSSLSETIRRYVRQSIGRRQIQGEYPVVDRILQTTLTDQMRAKFACWKTLNTPREKLLFPPAVAARFLIRTICDMLGGYLYHRKLHSNYWRPAVTTKNGCRLSQLCQSRKMKEEKRFFNCLNRPLDSRVAAEPSALRAERL